MHKGVKVQMLIVEEGRRLDEKTSKVIIQSKLTAVLIILLSLNSFLGFFCMPREELKGSYLLRAPKTGNQLPSFSQKKPQSLTVLPF